MITIIIRTAGFFIFLTLYMRIMGKRQVGELELTEFVTAVMVSELAALPITDKNIPVIYGVFPVITVAFIETAMALICRKSVKIRRFMSGAPVVLVAKGKIIENNLTISRFSIDEVFSLIRLQGYIDISEVSYVILEQTGQISVLPNAAGITLTASDAGIKPTVKGIGHYVVVEGKIDMDELNAVSKSESWLYKRCKANNIKIEDLVYFAVDDNGSYTFQEKRSK